MNKTDFIAAVAARAGITQADAGRAVDAVLVTVTERAWFPRLLFARLWRRLGLPDARQWVHTRIEESRIARGRFGG